MGEKYEVTNLDEFDVEEIHENCTVQILRTSRTGEVSIGWREGTIEDEPLIGNPYGLMS